MCNPKKVHLPAQKLCDKWAAHAKPHPAESSEAHPKIHDPGGQPTGFEDPCRTLAAEVRHGKRVDHAKLTW